MDEGFRVEHDTMGEVRVPAAALWGAQTQRAVDNFPISGQRFGRELIAALASIKGVSATVNASLRVLPRDIAEAIHDAASEVASGRYDDQFPIDVFQTGSGTSTNMNMKESWQRSQPAFGQAVQQPDDHVKLLAEFERRLSVAVHLAAVRAVVRDLIPSLQTLRPCCGPATQERTRCEGGAHPLDGRRARDARTGTRRLRTRGRSRFERLEACLPGSENSPFGGNRGRYRAQRAEAIRSGRHRELASDMELPLVEALTTSSAGFARRARRDEWRHPHDRCQPLQDRERPSLDELRTGGRPRRDPPP